MKTRNVKFSIEKVEDNEYDIVAEENGVKKVLMIAIEDRETAEKIMAGFEEVFGILKPNGTLS